MKLSPIRGVAAVIAALAITSLPSGASAQGAAFDSPVVSSQWLADHLNDPNVVVLHLAAWAMAGGSGETELAMAKAYAAEACLAVARRSHQILGAIGYCQEHPLPLLHTRIHAAALDFGDPVAHLETVARAIGLAPP